MEKHWPTSKLSHEGYWSKEDFNIDVCALHDGFYMSDQGYSRLLVCLYLFMFTYACCLKVVSFPHIFVPSITA